MSRDPLEELFGPISEEPEPTPASEPLPYEQPEPVRTAKLQTAAPKRSTGAKPWIIVGSVAVVAIIASVVFVNMARGGGGEAAPTSSAVKTTTVTKTPTATKTETPSPEPSDKPETPETPEKGEVPKVDVGPTMDLPIPSWNVTSQLSAKFGQTSYGYPNNDNVTLILDSPLTQGLPESCKAMRTQWGAKRLENGTFEVAKPAERCAEAPEYYDELWGLTDAFVKSIKPM